MDGKILYDTGNSPINGPVALVTVALLVGAMICLVIYFRQRRAKTLKPENGVVLLVVAALTGITGVVAAVSVIPDVIRPPVIERGRVLQVYDKLIDPENGVIVGMVKLSNGADVTLPDVLRAELKPGACVEITRTPATDYVLSARELSPDACLIAQ